MLIRLFAAFLVYVAASANNPTFAQASEPGTADSVPIEQIIVTGARVPLSIDRIGSAISVISRDDIAMRQARYLTDLLRSVPGFAVSQTGVTGSQTQVRVRGAEANHVLVMIDGVRANDPATGDEFRWEHLSASNIERIEIIRGPQSALWGTDAVGAVVHVITQTSTPESRFAGFAEAGSNGTQNIGVGGSARVGSWVIDANVESLDTDGDNISRLGTEEDGSELATGSVAVRYSHSDRLDVHFGIRAIDASSDTDQTDFINTGLPIDADRETRSDNLLGHAGFSLVSGQGDVTYRGNVRYFDSDQRNFTDGTQDSSTSAERVSLSGQADIALGQNRLSLVLEHEDSQFEQRGAATFGNPNQDQDLQVSSVTAEYAHLSAKRFTWILSGRYDKNSDFDDVFTGKASASYAWGEQTRIRASIGTGQKAPTFTERFGFFPGQFIGNPDLEPETSLSYEVGFDRTFADEMLLLQVSVYRQVLENEINGFVFDPTTFLSTAENRTGDSDRSGVEVGAQWEINPFISAGATYTYTDASEDNASGVSVNELRRPRHAGSVTVNYTSAQERFRFALAADYGGTRDDVFFPPFPQTQQIVTLDRYWLVDAIAHVQLSKSVTGFVRVNNLLDESHEQVFGFRTLGRAAYVGFRMAFGN